MIPARVGVIGCGTISPAYLTTLAGFGSSVRVVACADIALDVAKQRAEQFGISRACSPEELLGDPDVEIVLNLTIPKAHAEVSLAAIEAGKSVYSEKPLAIDRDDGRHLVTAARAHGVRLGCAPDTVLGGGFQSARKLLDDGAIGTPIGAFASFCSIGPEIWHPNPEFYFKEGAGPLFDMSPYYFTALVNLLGPARTITAVAAKPRAVRTIYSQPFHGRRIDVDVPTHVTGAIEFASGPVCTFLTSWEVWSSNLPRIEIYGTAGVLSVPDPNAFGGPVGLWSRDMSHEPSLEDLRREWNYPDLTHIYTEQSRGLGVADLAYALRSGRPHRANGDVAYHVLDMMCGFVEASAAGRRVELESHCERPAPLPVGLQAGHLDP